MLRRSEDISGSLESLNQVDMHEKLNRHQTRRYSCPQIMTASTLLMAEGTKVKEIEEEEEDEDDEDKDEDNVFTNAFFDSAYKGQMDADDDVVRSNTEFLLNVMELQQRKRRGSSKSAWDSDDDDFQETIDEDVEDKPSKRILWAAENNEIEIVKELLANDKELVDCLDEDLYTPLHRAAYNGHTSMVQLLLEEGASVHACTVDGWQPLHCAARWNNASVATILLQHDSDVNAQTNGGQTPLHLASSNPEAKEMLKILLADKHLDAEIVNCANEKAYDIARRAGRLAHLFESLGVQEHTDVMPSSSKD